MDGDEIQRSIGELKGLVTAHHQDVTKRIEKLGDKVEGLHNLHQRLKGGMAAISFVIVAVFHLITEGIRAKLR